MQIIYIKKVNLQTKENILKPYMIFKKIINKIKYIFYKIKIKKISKNKMIMTIPYTKEIKEKQAEKIARKIAKKKKEKEIVIVLAKNVIQDENLKKILKNYRYTILDRTWLFLNIIDNIIEYIADKQNKRIEEYIISILANNTTKQEKEIIKKLARKSKINEYYY